MERGRFTRVLCVFLLMGGSSPYIDEISRMVRSRDGWPRLSPLPHTLMKSAHIGGAHYCQLAAITAPKVLW